MRVGWSRGQPAAVCLWLCLILCALSFSPDVRVQATQGPLQPASEWSENTDRRMSERFAEMLTAEDMAVSSRPVTSVSTTDRGTRCFCGVLVQEGRTVVQASCQPLNNLPFRELDTSYKCQCQHVSVSCDADARPKTEVLSRAATEMCAGVQDSGVAPGPLPPCVDPLTRQPARCGGGTGLKTLVQSKKALNGTETKCEVVTQRVFCTNTQQCPTGDAEERPMPTATQAPTPAPPAPTGGKTAPPPPPPPSVKTASSTTTTTNSTGPLPSPPPPPPTGTKGSPQSSAPPPVNGTQPTTSTKGTSTKGTSTKGTSTKGTSTKGTQPSNAPVKDAQPNSGTKAPTAPTAPASAPSTKGSTTQAPTKAPTKAPQATKGSPTPAPVNSSSSTSTSHNLPQPQQTHALPPYASPVPSPVLPADMLPPALNTTHLNTFDQQLQAIGSVNTSGATVTTSAEVDTTVVADVNGTAPPDPEKDCLAGPWGKWSVCSVSCGKGHRHRSRAILKRHRPGGAQCGAVEERVVCELPECPVPASTPTPSPVNQQTPVNSTASNSNSNSTQSPSHATNSTGNAAPTKAACSPWGPWSNCSASCGKGNMTRTRAHPSSPECTEPQSETRECEEVPCGPRVCLMSPWSEWSDCNTQYRKRRVRVVRNRPDGVTCPATEEVAQCQQPVDCVVGPWEGTGTCSVTCGSGTSIHRRQVLVQARNGGAQCPPLEQAVSCRGPPCMHGCQVSVWSEWSDCNADGYQRRVRSVLHREDYVDCPCLEQLRRCHPCEKQIRGNWSQWSDCDAHGAQQRVRSLQHVQDPACMAVLHTRQSKACDAHHPAPPSALCGPNTCGCDKHGVPVLAPRRRIGHYSGHHPNSTVSTNTTLADNSTQSASSSKGTSSVAALGGSKGSSSGQEHDIKAHDESDLSAEDLGVGEIIHDEEQLAPVLHGQKLPLGDDVDMPAPHAAPAPSMPFEGVNAGDLGMGEHDIGVVPPSTTPSAPAAAPGKKQAPSKSPEHDIIVMQPISATQKSGKGANHTQPQQPSSAHAPATNVDEDGYIPGGDAKHFERHRHEPQAQRPHPLRAVTSKCCSSDPCAAGATKCGSHLQCCPASASQSLCHPEVPRCTATHTGYATVMKPSSAAAPGGVTIMQPV